LESNSDEGGSDAWETDEEIPGLVSEDEDGSHSPAAVGLLYKLTAAAPELRSAPGFNP
jgi:hypothetical protein